MNDQRDPCEIEVARECMEQVEAEVVSGARAKTMTEKGLDFPKDNKYKHLSGLFRKLKRKSDDMKSKMMDGKQDGDNMRREYKDWMLMYEELLSVHTEYCALLSETERQNYLDDIYEDRNTCLKNFKAAYSNWQINVDSQKAKIQFAVKLEV